MTRGRDLPKLNSNPTHPHVTNALPLPLHLVEDLISSKRSRCVWNNGVFFVVVPHRGKFGISCWLLLISSKTFSCLSFENSLICFNNGQWLIRGACSRRIHASATYVSPISIMDKASIQSSLTVTLTHECGSPFPSILFLRLLTRPSLRVHLR